MFLSGRYMSWIEINWKLTIFHSFSDGSKEGIRPEDAVVSRQVIYTVQNALNDVELCHNVVF
jgi:hypothetical protein